MMIEFISSTYFFEALPSENRDKHSVIGFLAGGTIQNSGGKYTSDEADKEVDRLPGALNDITSVDILAIRAMLGALRVDRRCS
jgi:hypothetical protein